MRKWRGWLRPLSNFMGQIAELVYEDYNKATAVNQFREMIKDDTGNQF